MVGSLLKKTVGSLRIPFPSCRASEDTSVKAPPHLSGGLNDTGRRGVSLKRGPEEEEAEKLRTPLYIQLFPRRALQVAGTPHPTLPQRLHPQPIGIVQSMSEKESGLKHLVQRRLRAPRAPHGCQAAGPRLFRQPVASLMRAKVPEVLPGGAHPPGHLEAGPQHLLPSTRTSQPVPRLGPGGARCEVDCVLVT